MHRSSPDEIIPNDSDARAKHTHDPRASAGKRGAFPAFWRFSGDSTPVFFEARLGGMIGSFTGAEKMHDERIGPYFWPRVPASGAEARQSVPAI